jgi:hypothetical protein
MAEVEITWLQVKELPTLVSSWHDIRYYAGSDVNIPTKQCVYCIRLSPPYMIHYSGPSKQGYDDDFVSPLIYIGSGNAKGRLGSHLSWLRDLGQTLPNIRYEIWIAQPKVQNNAKAYASFEGYLLHQFEKHSRGWLPLRNKKKQAFNPSHNYPSNIFKEVVGHDRRYSWAIWPYRGKWNDVYRTGGTE